MCLRVGPMGVGCAGCCSIFGEVESLGCSSIFGEVDSLGFCSFFGEVDSLGFVRYLVKSIPWVWCPYPFHSLLFLTHLFSLSLIFSHYPSFAPFRMHDPHIKSGDTIWY